MREKQEKHLLRFGLKCRSQQRAGTVIRRNLQVIKRFHSFGQQLCKFIKTKDSVYMRKKDIPTGLVWVTSMTACSLFRDSIMAAAAVKELPTRHKHNDTRGEVPPQKKLVFTKGSK